MASVTTSTRKKTVLTIKEKYTALKDLEKGLSKKAIAEKFNVPKNTLTYWIKNKHDIIQKYETGQLGAKRQKLSVGKHDSIDKAVYKWFMNARERNVPIGGYIIREKALDFAKELNITDFKASDGWLDRWKNRHNVVFRAISGEERSCTEEMTASWAQTHLPTILSRYDLRDIYNADEFGLFYQQLPTKSFHLKGERCAGGKFSKVRLTGLAAGNAAGEKLPMFVIGKAEKPRCFKGVTSLPCQYKPQRKSWMDSEIFSDYVRKLDTKFDAEGRKIVLIIDNCPAHPNVDNLKAIQLVFLPPNTTSKTQPMDQGVIRALKAFYRTNVVRRQIKYVDEGKTTPKINILQAMRMLVKSWDAISINTVKNCFRKAGISQETQVASINEEDDPFKLLQQNVDELKSRDLVDENLTVDDYVDIDFQVTTSETSAMTDQEILDSILINDLAEEEEEETEEESSDVPPEKPKLAEVAHAIDLLERWSLFDKNGGEMRKSLSLISKRFDKHSFESKKQSQIPDFFKTS